MVAAVFIGNIGIKPATTPLIRKFGFKAMLVFASLASAVTFALCAFLTPETPQVLTFVLLVCSGAFRSIGFSAYASVQYADIPPAQLTSANTVSATLVQLGTGSGIAIAALLIRIFNGQALAPQDPAGPFRGAFVAMAVLMLASTVDSLLLPKHAGAAVSQRRPARDQPARDATGGQATDRNVAGSAHNATARQSAAAGAVSPPAPEPGEEQLPHRPAEGRARRR
jgi:MFS family permease